VEAQAQALIAAVWVSAADILSAMWPIFVFPIGLAAVFAVGTWVRGLFS